MIGRLLAFLRGADVERLRERNLALQLDVRRLEVDLAHQQRLTLGANEAAERAYRERDAANAQALSWLRVAGDQSEALVLQGAAKDRQLSGISGQLSLPDRTVVPFGRRRPPA